MSLKDKVYNYKTKYEMGFTHDEVHDLLQEYPNINMDKFNNAMMGNTCSAVKEYVLNPNKFKRIFKRYIEKLIILNYHCDVLTALKCGIEGRDIYPSEFD